MTKGHAALYIGSEGSESLEITFAIWVLFPIVRLVEQTTVSTDGTNFLNLPRGKALYLLRPVWLMFEEIFPYTLARLMANGPVAPGHTVSYRFGG